MYYNYENDIILYLLTKTLFLKVSIKELYENKH